MYTTKEGITVKSERLSDNKEIFGDIKLNSNVFRKYLEDIDVPNDIFIKVIDISISTEEYLKVAEELAENHSNKIILSNSFASTFIKSAIGEERFTNLFSKRNVILLMVPISSEEIKKVIAAFLKFHSA